MIVTRLSKIEQAMRRVETHDSRVTRRTNLHAELARLEREIDVRNVRVAELHMQLHLIARAEVAEGKAGRK